jgi:type I restriction enzyme S subunit
MIGAAFQSFGALKKVRFGDVVQLGRERSAAPEQDGYARFVGLEHIESGDLRIRRWGSVADGVSFTTVFHPGQVLFGKRRAYQRKVALADFSGVCSSDIYVLEPRGEALCAGMLPFICSSDGFIAHAVRNSAGSLSPRAKWEELADYQFMLPERSVQERMLCALRSSSRCLAADSDLTLALKDLRAAVLSRLGEVALSRGEKAKVRDVLRLSRTSVTPIPDRVYQEIGIRSFGKGVFHKEPCMGADIGEKRVFAVEPGRLVFNVVFAWEGAVAITSESDAGLIASHRFPMYESASSSVSLQFLKYFFLTPRGLQLLGDASPGGAGRNRTLGQDRFAEQLVPIPSLETQLELLNDLLAADSALTDVALRQTASRRLHSSLVEGCLHGEAHVV